LSPHSRASYLRLDNDNRNFRSQSLQLSSNQSGLRAIIVKINNHGIHRFLTKPYDSIMTAARADHTPTLFL